MAIGTVRKPLPFIVAPISIDFRLPPDLVRQCLVLLSYVAMALLLMNFYRPQYGLLASVGSAVVTDFALTLFLEKKIRVPLGAVIAGISIWFFVHSRYDCTP